MAVSFKVDDAVENAKSLDLTDETNVREFLEKFSTELMSGRRLQLGSMKKSVGAAAARGVVSSFTRRPAVHARSDGQRHRAALASEPRRDHRAEAPAGPPAATRSRCSGSGRARYSLSPRSRTTRPLPTSAHSRRWMQARS